MGSVPEFNIFDIAANSVRSTDGDDSWNSRYDQQASYLKDIVLGSPFSLLSRSFDCALVTGSGYELMAAPQTSGNSFFYIPTMIAVHYVPSAKLGNGTNGFSVKAAASNSATGVDLMKEVRFGNTDGADPGRRWVAGDTDVIYASLHSLSLAATDAVGSPGTWPVTPIDWVNRDLTNLHSDSSKPYPAHVLKRTQDADLPGAGPPNVYITALGSNYTVPQIDLFGITMQKSN